MPECIEKKKLLKAIEESEPDVMADYGEYYGSEWGISRGKLYEIIANLPTLTQPNEWVTCRGCMHAPDCPSGIHCYGCARLYADNYRRPPEVQS